MKDTLPDFCQKIVENAIPSSKEDVVGDLFGKTRILFEHLLRDDKALGGIGRKLSFHCQHILMNCNELIADWPFGYPQQIIFGYGGEVGVKMLRQISSRKFTKEQRLEAVLDFVKSRDVWELNSIGIELSEENVLRCCLNQREICLADVEHWCCLGFIHCERQPGGSRGFSRTSETTFPHCHPI